MFFLVFTWPLFKQGVFGGVFLARARDPGPCSASSPSSRLFFLSPSPAAPVLLPCAGRRPNPVPTRPWSRGSTLSTRCQPRARGGQAAGIPIVFTPVLSFVQPALNPKCCHRHRVGALRLERNRRSTSTFRLSLPVSSDGYGTNTKPPALSLCASLAGNVTLCCCCACVMFLYAEF